MHQPARLVSTILAALLVLGLAPVALAAPPPHAGSQGDERVLVRVGPANGRELPGQASGVAGWRVVPVRGSERAQEVLQRLRSDPKVDEAYLEPTYSVTGTAPNDPMWGAQWNMSRLGVTDAWGRSTGNGVTVAVIDTGITRGTDLACRRLAGEYDAINKIAGSGSARDVHGHGTHVAGTVAQCTNNGKGVAGVAPNARLLAIRAIDENGAGSESAVVRGIDWAVAKGADVINLSLGRSCSATWPSCGSSMLNDAIERAIAKRVVIVGAAGNDGRGYLSYPANHPDVIGVTATTSGGRLAGYSNYGKGVSVSAPGGDGSDRDGDGRADGILQGNNSGGYSSYMGTSMATPHVAGVAALLLGAKSSLSPAQVRSLIEKSARDRGPSGYDRKYGHGEVRADHALTRLLGSLTDPVDRTTKTATGSFKDVSSGSTFKTDILWLAGEGITKGCNPPANDRFCPDQSVTRAQMAAFLVRAKGLSQTSSAGRFRDVRSSSTFAADINRLATADITKGCNPPANDRFCPDAPVTRAQMAAFVSRAFGLPSGSVRFRDVPRSSTFFRDISRLAKAGITKGCNPPANDRYCPDAPVTRAQMAAFLHRALG